MCVGKEIDCIHGVGGERWVVGGYSWSMGEFGEGGVGGDGFVEVAAGGGPGEARVGGVVGVDGAVGPPPRGAVVGEDEFDFLARRGLLSLALLGLFWFGRRGLGGLLAWLHRLAWDGLAWRRQLRLAVSLLGISRGQAKEKGKYEEEMEGSYHSCRNFAWW